MTYSNTIMPVPVGTKFNHWTTIADEVKVGRNRKVLCQCKCGKVKLQFLSVMRGGQSRQCGSCAMRKHGEGVKRTPEFRSWLAMVERCTNPNKDQYSYYGGRGISVHPEWRGRGGYEKFLAHVGRKPTLNHTLDRINNDGNYEPGNVRWATRSEQALNRRRAGTCV